jgi:hypothetical protein
VALQRPDVRRRPDGRPHAVDPSHPRGGQPAPRGRTDSAQAGRLRRTTSAVMVAAPSGSTVRRTRKSNRSTPDVRRVPMRPFIRRIRSKR